MPDTEPRGRGIGRSLLRGCLPAAAFALAFPPVGWWPLALAWPALVAVAALAAPSRRAAFIGLWLPHAAAWLLLDAWLIDVAALGWPFLALYMAAWPALVGLLVRTARAGGPMSALPVALVLAVAWSGLEVARSVYLFDGYPWYLLAQPLVELPVLVQSASLLGVFFTGFLVAGISGAAVDLWIAVRRRSAGRAAVAGAASGAVAAVAALVHGGLSLASVDRGLAAFAASDAVPPRLVVVQTNLPQSNKLAWPIDQQWDALQRWIGIALDGVERSRRGDDGLAARNPDLVLFPETMIPGFGFQPNVRVELGRAGDARAEFPAVVERLAEVAELVVLAGTTNVDGLVAAPHPEAGFRYELGPRTNAVVVVGADGPVGRYDKRFLTPFGETMPWLSSWPWLERQLLRLAAGGMHFDLEAGRGPRRIAVPATGVDPLVVAAPICFEATVPGLVHELMHGHEADFATEAEPAEPEAVPGVIVNLSNDGWFGRSDAGRRRHAQMARFRAIEHRRPLVRAVNTGYSILVDPAGRITDRLGPGDYGTAGREDALVADLPQEDRPRLTTYARLGPIWPPVSCGLALGLALAGILYRGTPAADVAAGLERQPPDAAAGADV